MSHGLDHLARAYAVRHRAGHVGQAQPVVADKARVAQVLGEAGWYQRTHREARRPVAGGVQAAALADQHRAVLVDNEKGLVERAQQSAQFSRMLRRAKLPASPAPEDVSPEDVLRDSDGSFRITLPAIGSILRSTEPTTIYSTFDGGFAGGSGGRSGTHHGRLGARQEKAPSHTPMV